MCLSNLIDGVDLNFAIDNYSLDQCLNIFKIKHRYCICRPRCLFRYFRTIVIAIVRTVNMCKAYLNIYLFPEPVNVL